MMAANSSVAMDIVAASRAIRSSENIGLLESGVASLMVLAQKLARIRINGKGP